MSWKTWNPKKLQAPISTALRTEANKRKFVACDDLTASPKSQNKICKGNNVMPSALKETATKTKERMSKDNNNLNNTKKRVDKFGALADRKGELVSIMISNGNEKHNFEIELIKLKLQKEKLKIEILQKELQLKSFILEKEQRRLE